MTVNQPSARESTDALPDEDDTQSVAEESDSDSELEQMLTAFYAD